MYRCVIGPKAQLPERGPKTFLDRPFLIHTIFVNIGDFYLSENSRNNNLSIGRHRSRTFANFIKLLWAVRSKSNGPRTFGPKTISTFHPPMGIFSSDGSGVTLSRSSSKNCGPSISSDGRRRFRHVSILVMSSQHYSQRCRSFFSQFIVVVTHSRNLSLG